MKDPAAASSVADEWAAAVALACICDQAIAGPSVGTDHVIGDAAGTIFVPTLLVADYGDFRLLLDAWLRAPRIEGAPTGDETHLAAHQLLGGVWQTHGASANVQRECGFQLQEREVVLLSAGVVVGTHDDLLDSAPLRIVV